MYFLARASIDHGLKWFGLAGLFFGLGVWDKLTFLLCFAPVTLVLLAAALRKLPRTRITKALSLVLLTAVLGSLPFLLALSQDRTHSTSQLQVEVEKLSLKAGTFARSMTGTVLTGYFTSRDAYVDTIPDAAWAYFARVTDRILQLSDYDRWIVLALLLIAVGIPGKTQPGRLLLMLSFALSWLTMAMFQNLGG